LRYYLILRHKYTKFYAAKSIFLTFSIGRPKHVRVMAGALEGDIFIGPKAQEHRGLLSIRYPMEVCISY